MISSNANGTNVSYAWDANNRLQSVTDIRTTGVTSYSYDATNQMASLPYPNDVTHGFGFDTQDRTTNLNVTGPGGVLDRYSQNYSFSGHKQSVMESSDRAANYKYDSIYRLTNQNIASDPHSIFSSNDEPGAADSSGNGVVGNVDVCSSIWATAQ